MEETAPSRTALGVTALRAAHQLFDSAPRILDDPLAPQLLSGAERRALAERPDWIDSPATRRLRSRLVVRGRYAEDRLAGAIARGVDQYVILGAGYDSFAWRQPAWAATARIFEVDHPATQAEKRARLAAAGAPIPANLAFTPIDFETTSLADGLRASALDFSRLAFFSCLGVIVYLSRPAVDAIFELVAGFPEGSEIVFTFAASARGETAGRAAAAREPWLTFFSPRQLEPMLKALGFQAITFLEPGDTARFYFPAPRDDGLEAPATTFIGAATVGPK
ncbi:MAG: class I SAM-dependent methyltransferase [Caulobacteraceae bacterium]